MRRVNLDALDLVVDDEPGSYRAPYASLRDPLGARRLAATLVALGPGQAVCPYHHEVAEEEWLLVLDGAPSVRGPNGTERFAPGDVVCFPRGPEGAHKILNESPEPARILILSERADCAATVYPDSDKVGIFAPGMRMLFRRSDQREYWDGENGDAAG